VLQSAVVKNSIPVGMRNIGDSCHLNAILTALASSWSFRSYARGVAVQCGGFAALLHGILQSADGHRQGVAMIETRSLAYELATEGFRVDTPRDADETYDRILSVLNAQLTKAIKADRMQSLGLRSAQGRDPVCLSGLRSLPPCAGFFERRMQCTTCKNMGDSRVEIFNRLSLSMPGVEAEQVDLESCLREVTSSKETIDGVWCQMCSTATRQVLFCTVSRLPRLLCLHLKRLTWNAESGMPVHDDRAVRVRSFLGPSSFFRSRSERVWPRHAANQYRLRSVILHIRQTGNSGGHYTCLRFSQRSVINMGMASLAMEENGGADHGVWFYVNDDNVTPTAVEDGCSIKSAYMLFYELVEDTTNGTDNW